MICEVFQNNIEIICIWFCLGGGSNKKNIDDLFTPRIKMYPEFC